MASKLGPHVIRPTPEALDWARAAPVVKSLDPSALRAATRATIRVYRHYAPVQDVNRNGADVAAEVLAALGDAPATHVELFNETAQRLGQGLERYVEMTREAVRYLTTARPDLTLVAFCFSTGNAEREDWDYLRAHGYGEAEVIGLHQYWGAQGFTPWHALRHRLVHAWTDAAHPPFLITECGRDRVEGGRGGWRADGLAEGVYLDELLDYERELLADGYVLGATPFTAGPTEDWRAFDTDPLSGRLAALAGLLPTPPEERPVTIKGIDVSNNNGRVDLAAVRSAGYRFVAIKASQDTPGGGFRDAFFAENWRNAQEMGLARIAYHMTDARYASVTSSVGLVEEMVDGVGGLRPGDAVALDAELGPMPEVWFAEALDLASRVFRHAVWKYSGRWYTLQQALENPAFEPNPTWFVGDPGDAEPPGWRPVRMWQTTLPPGSVPGVTGACDVNTFMGTIAQLRGLGLVPAPTDWETPVLGPIYRGASAVGGMPDRTPEDEADAVAIIARMDKVKARHPA